MIFISCLTVILATCVVQEASLATKVSDWHQLLCAGQLSAWPGRPAASRTEAFLDPQLLCLREVLQETELVKTRHQTAIRQDQQNVCFRERSDRNRSWPDFCFFECYCVLCQERNIQWTLRGGDQKIKGLGQSHPESFQNLNNENFTVHNFSPSTQGGWGRRHGDGRYGGKSHNCIPCLLLEWVRSLISFTELTCPAPSLRIQIDLELTFTAMH